MTKNELSQVAFNDKKEIKLKSKLMNLCEEYNTNKAFISLAINNQLLLNSCNIDENEFNQILFKNYILHANFFTPTFIENLKENELELLNTFNCYVMDNNFDEAFKIFANNNIIYQLLCKLYITDLVKTEKLSNINERNIDSIYKRILLLKNTNLTFERESKLKIYFKESAK